MIRRLTMRFLVWVGYNLGLIYIAEEDAADYILPILEEEEEIIEEEVVEVITGYPVRWDGANGSPDYTKWTYIESVVWRNLGWVDKSNVKLTYDAAGDPVPIVGSSKKRATYMKIRPLVVQGLSNSQIVASTGLASSTVDGYAKAVRDALKIRYDEDNHTPTLSEEGESETPVNTEIDLPI